MADIRLKISAQADADFGAIIFAPIAEGAKRAKAEVRAQMREASQEAKRVARANDAENRRVAREGAAFQRELDKASAANFRAQVRERATLERQAVRETAALQRAADKATATAARAQMREQAQEAQRAERRSQANQDQMQGIGGGTMRNFGGMLRHGVGMAADLARGGGLDLSLGGALKDRMAMQTTATDLTNSGYMPGTAGANGQRQDPRAVMAEAQKVGIDTGTDPQKALEGLSKFVGKTGDLETGRAVLGDLAKLSKATGANMEDMVDAAADVSANLGDVKDKGAMVQGVMRAFAGQGKQGAIEIKDLAKQMAGLAAQAGMFAGDKADNMALLGAIAQEARQKGGSKSAAQAVTSVQSLMGTFTKGRAGKAFGAEHVDLFTDKSNTQLRNVQDIMTDAIQKTGGDMKRLNKMFADVRAQSAVRGFSSTYTEAVRGAKASGASDKDAAAAGSKALAAEFDNLKKAAMGQGEVDESFKRAMGTTESQFAVLKNKLSQSLGDTAEKLAPKLLELAPAATGAVESFGKLAIWAANNPMKAAFAGFGASAAKSIGEQMMTGGFGKNLQMGTAAISIASAALTAYQVGTVLIDKALDEKRQGANRAIGNEMEGLNAETRLRHADKGVAAAEGGAMGFGGSSAYYMTDFAEQAQDAYAQQADYEQQQALAEAEKKKGDLQKAIDSGTDRKADDSLEGTESFAAHNTWLSSHANSLLGTDFFGSGQNAQQYSDAGGNAEQLDQLKAQMASLEAVMKGTLRVEVTNQPGPGAPTVNGAARTGI